MRSRLFLLPLCVVTTVAAPLAVTDIKLHQYEDGPALAPSYRFTAGENVALSFRVSGFKPAPDKQVKLAYTIESVDEEGTALAPPREGSVDVELADEDKDWLPKLRHEAMVPDTPAPGRHQFRIRVRDLVAGAEATATVAFDVRGKKVERSATLGVQNFGFFRSEDSPTPAPSFRPGDTVWARFDITGYKHGEKNLYDIRYGVALRDAAGKELFRQDNGAAQSDSSFYPRRWLNAALSINLDRNIRAGEYTLTVFLLDPIGRQTAEASHRFQVE